MEPICESKFYERSNGFRPNRSAENAIAQCYKMINLQKLYFVVDVDIKGFFTAISQLSPETVSRVPNECHNNRWYANQSALTERILQVLNIIHTDYMEDLSLNYLADQVYTSPCYFSTMFTRFLGISPMTYLNELRMNKAEELLRDSSINLQQICEMVGYRNLPYFCTCFKRKHQMTPTQFRRKCCVPLAS
jgi:YesN/AraC family two-component response regulator